ncbi:MAG: zinc ABC transporter substrate-binding protein [Propionibacterium sp.]|nr:zinc ABC transporter substrate-binding protein [Propionibacterium sp.]
MIIMKKLTLALLPTALLLSACGGAPAAENEKPRVVVSFYALEYAAQEVVGDAADVTTLTMPGVDAHDLDLRPSQIADIGTADLVVYLDGFQPAVDDAVGQAGHDRVLDVTDAADLIEAHDDHDHDDHDHDDHDHDHGDHDPHFWQDPERMAQVGRAIAEELGATYPEHAEQFRQGADALAEEMVALDDEYRTGLAECTRSEFVTSHQAFGYLADRYGLTEIAISGLSPEAEPSPARIADVHHLAEEHGITTIFFETLTSPAVAEAIAGDLGVATAILDPLEGVSENSPGDDYPSIMRANLEALRVANDC